MNAPMSLRSKIVTLIVAVSGLTIILGLFGFAIYQQRIARDLLIDNVLTQARLIALFSETPLSFGMPDELKGVIERAELPTLREATIRDVSGAKVAQVISVVNNTTTPVSPQAIIAAGGVLVQNDDLYVHLPIGDSVQQLGTLTLRVSLQDLQQSLRRQLAVMLFGGSFLLAVCWLLALRLQRYVTAPIIDLARLSAKVAETHDFGVRASVVARDEIGALARNFNYMLDEIDERERARDRAESALRESKQNLEAAVQELHQLANYDALTTLPNRSLCMDRISSALTRAQRERTKVAVVFLDLDHFKVINDSLGHAVGDELLRAASGRLLACLRRGDTLARLGGDEFVLVLEDLLDELLVSAILDKITAAFGEAFSIGGFTVSTTVSMGVSIFPTDGRDVQSLMRNADTAMYKAKEIGRNTYQFYQPEMNAMSLRRLNLATELRESVAKNQLELFYQPQIRSRDKHIIGVEALLRWKHPTLGAVSPVEFIPIAETSGFIVPMGLWVIEQAAKQLAQWREQGHMDLRVAVNISAVQFRQADLAEQVSRIVQKYDVPPAQLELELTESLLMRDADGTIQQLNRLKAMGFRLVIDDFGTGYSSLNYLRRFPIDGLKIDRSFIDEVTRNSDDTQITLTILSMARNLRLSVVAEGVETPEQFAFLLHNDCDEVQGYLFSPPIPEAGMSRLLHEQQTQGTASIIVAKLQSPMSTAVSE